MSRRTVGLTVVLTVIGVAFVLEGWTFVDLIMMQFTDQDTEHTETTSGEASDHRMSAGDVIELDAECSVRIDEMRLHAGTSTWTFRMDVTARNSGARPIMLRSGSVTLSTGNRVPLERPVTVPGDGSVSFVLSTDVPQGTEVTGWRLTWRRETDEGTWNDRSIPLNKAPVRRRDE